MKSFYYLYQMALNCNCGNQSLVKTTLMLLNVNEAHDSGVEHRQLAYSRLAGKRQREACTLDMQVSWPGL